MPILHRTIAPLLAFAAACSLWSCGGALSATGPGPTAPVTVDVPVASGPPPDKQEPARPASPGFGYLWVAGHWDNIDGNFIWKGGRWIPAKADYEYVRARYEFDQTKGTWIYHRPHWKRRHAQAPAPAPIPDGGA